MNLIGDTRGGSRGLKDKILHFFYYNLGTGFGLGFSPYAPGTLGSLLGLVLVYLFFPASFILQVLFLLPLCFASVYISSWVAESENSSDPSIVIIDEVVGQVLVFLFIPQPLSWKLFLVGFLLFRIFDIWKPWIIKKAEKLPRGWGIVADDLVAGLFANLILHLWLFF